MRQRWTTLMLGGVFAATVAPARADRFETSIGADVRGAIARVAEPGASAQSVPAIGADVRVTHAWRNALAWDVTGAALMTRPATYRDAEVTVDGRPSRGDMTRSTVTVGAQLGAELRLGVRTVPTLRLGLGPQLRHRSSSDLGTQRDAVPSSTTLDVCASLALGVDLRFGEHAVVSLALQLDHAQPLGDAAPLDVLGVTVRLSRYFYPRWWGPSW